MSSVTNASPFFGVDIDLLNIGVDIRVNDIPIYFDQEKGQLTVEVPAPDSIIDDLNTLTILASLPEDNGTFDTEYEEGAYASATLFRQDGEGVKKKLASVVIRFNPDGVQLAETENYLTKKKSTSTITLSKQKNAQISESVEIKSPFPVWAWQDGQVIENNEDNFNTLLAAYKEIHSTLSAKDLKKLKELYRFRAQEIAIAYGLSGERAGHDKLSTGKDMNNPNLELYDFHTDGMKLDIIGNGRLARISDQDHDQPILYYEAKPSLLHLYKFIFFLNKENKWIMIR